MNTKVTMNFRSNTFRNRLAQFPRISVDYTTLNNRHLNFKIDTGADVTVISEEEYCEQNDGPLQPTDRVLSGPSQHPLEVQGQFEGTLQSAYSETQQLIYVLKGLRKALLGQLAINSLNIIQQIQPVHALNAISQFPELFTGLGRLKDNYAIKLTDDAKSFGLITLQTSCCATITKGQS